MAQFQIHKTNFTNTQLVDSPAPADIKLNTGEILLQIDRFAYTANNITYAVAGDMIGYWQFFPSLEDGKQDFGVTPVWGFADVIESSHSEIAPGERLYGYFPTAHHLIMNADQVSRFTLYDNSLHRQSLPKGYNLYHRVKANPHYNASTDNHYMLLQPLHLTGWCLWDYAKMNSWFGAEQIIILSASSKTSIATALSIKNDPESPDLIGLTSERNEDYVQSLDLYDQCASYQNLDQLDSTKKTLIIDMSGHIKVIDSISDMFGDHLKHCIQVGLTHWDQAGNSPKTKRKEFFFAPGHIQQRIKEWGFKEFTIRSEASVSKTIQQASKHLEIKEIQGLKGLQQIYDQIVNGNIPPQKGLTVKM